MTVGVLVCTCRRYLYLLSSSGPTVRSDAGMQGVQPNAQGSSSGCCQTCGAWCPRSMTCRCTCRTTQPWQPSRAAPDLRRHPCISISPGQSSHMKSTAAHGCMAMVIRRLWPVIDCPDTCKWRRIVPYIIDAACNKRQASSNCSAYWPSRISRSTEV